MTFVVEFEETLKQYIEVKAETKEQAAAFVAKEVKAIENFRNSYNGGSVLDFKVRNILEKTRRSK